MYSARLIELDHGYARAEYEKAGPQKNRASQRWCRGRKKVAFDGIEEVGARNRQRYYVRMAHLKATDQKVYGGHAALPRHVGGAAQ